MLEEHHDDGDCSYAIKRNIVGGFRDARRSQSHRSATIPLLGRTETLGTARFSALRPVVSEKLHFQGTKSPTVSTDEPIKAYLGRVRVTGTPCFQTSTMFRVAVIFAVGSPSTRTRSARRPGLMYPRSLKWKAAAGADVAAIRA